MSQVDGSIDIKFNGTQEALNKLECFMNENLSNFRSFSYYDFEYDKENQELYLDLYVDPYDIFYFLGLIVANIPEVGFSGVTVLDFIGSGGAYYAEYNHKAGDAMMSFEDGYDTDYINDIDDIEFNLELTYNSEDDDKIEKFIEECTLPMIDESEENAYEYCYEKEYFIYEKDSGYIMFKSFMSTTEQLKTLIDGLQKLSTQVDDLEGEAYFLTRDNDLVIISIKPNKGLSSFIIPVEYTQTSYFDE